MTEQELLADCLKRLNAALIDHDYLTHWAEAIGVSDLLQCVIDGKSPPKTT